MPQKAGFVFNAGAPVWSIDFLPAPCQLKPNSTPHKNKFTLSCDFLAVATISQDPGLLPPSEIKKQNKDMKSAVQIWSIPLIQPTNFIKSLGNQPVDGNMAPSDTVLPEYSNDFPKTSESSSGSAQLVMLLAFPSQATVVRWCPRGGSKSCTPAHLLSHPQTLASPLYNLSLSESWQLLSWMGQLGYTMYRIPPLGHSQTNHLRPPCSCPMNPIMFWF